MLWIILFVVVILISGFLALRSMKDYQETPLSHLSYGLFYLSQKSNFTSDTLTKLHQFALKYDCLISLERLFKGEDNVLVIYSPKQIVNEFPELALIELEDYLLPASSTSSSGINNDEKKINLNQVLPWIIEPKNNPKKTLSVKSSFLKMMELNPKQRFFWQIVIFPLKENTNFQVTIRSMAVDNDPNFRVELAKKLDTMIGENTGLTRKTKQPPASAIFESFRERTLIPKEVSSFVLDKQELFSLLGL